MRPASAGWKTLLILAATLLRASLCVAQAGEAGKGGATAGWAEVEITPPLGIALGGHGGAETLANRMIDPLYAQVLYLKDGKGTGFVLASFDLIGLPHDLSDRIRTRLVHELGVDWNLVVLNSSHTHSGPYMLRSLMAGVGPPPQVEVDYFNFLEEKMVAAARAAAKALQPVEVEVFQGTSQIGINRRGKNAEGRRAMLPDPNGPFDEKVWTMRLTPKDGGPPAVVFSCACHPVIIYGYAFAALSADFPGATRKLLRESFGGKAHAQFVQGFAGNIRPRILADPAAGRFRASKPGDVDQAARELTGAVLAALKTHGEKLTLDIAGAADRPFLPRDKPPPRERYDKMRAEALANTNAYRLAVSDYWLKRYETGDGFARGDAWSLGLIRLAGNQWVVHSGGEPCVEWRAKISQWLSPLNIVTWGYSQEAKSYLPTESMLPEGGYEVLESNQGRESTPAPFAPGIEQAMRESLLRQLAFIQAKTNKP
jgi:neutral ceramidase